MDLVECNKAEAVLAQIVQSFGDGELQRDKYVFEQIVRLPDGCSSRRVGVTEAVSAVSDADVLVVLDPHPNNAKSATEVAGSLGVVRGHRTRVAYTERTHPRRH